MSTDRGVRVEDYLNDRLQSQADLDNLDVLLQSVQEQQNLLRRQLENARSGHDASRRLSNNQAQTLLERAQSFQKMQIDIDKRMLVLTRSDVSDDAVHKFEKTMDRVGEMEIAEDYVGMLLSFERLVATASTACDISAKSALQPYAQLERVVNTFNKLRPASEEAAPQLKDYMDQRAQGLRLRLQSTLAGDLESVLRKIGWPGKNAHIDESLEQEWTGRVASLLDLQIPSLLAKPEGAQPIPLLPFETLVKPLVARFNYHFSGDRPTNRLDKPEYFLSHAVELLNDYDGFCAYNLQPVISKRFGSTHLALNPAYIDSTSALITAVLPMVKQKLETIIVEAAKQPQTLSHLIHELLGFDTSLRSDWNYGDGNGGDDWKGLAGDLLEKGWFDRWLEVEKDCKSHIPMAINSCKLLTSAVALKRYQDIIDTPESGEIDFDSVDPGVTKPTKAAMRVNDLLETITERYRPLVSFKQKMIFVRDIQVAIFDRYYERLREGLEAFVTLSNPLARKVQGFSREEAVAAQGIQGLERLCRIYGSTEYLTRKMSDWSNDVFFLELWDELQYQTRDIESSQALNVPIANISTKDTDGGGLFDEICGHYEKLRDRTEILMCEQMYGAVNEALRAYNRVNCWSSLELDPGVTVELEPVLQLLSQQLQFLSKSVANAPLRRICRHLLQQYQTWLWSHTITRNSFSNAGVEQLKCDMNALWNTFDLVCGQGVGVAGMRRLREALELLAMPLDSSDGVTTLGDIEQRIFRSNEDARTVLEELGLESLTEADARELIGKRVELGS